MRLRRCVLGGWVAAGLLVSTAAHGQEPRTVPSVKPMPGPAETFRAFVKVWETGDVSQLDRLVAADYIGHVAAGDRNRDVLRQRILAFRSAYPTIHFDVQAQISSGDLVASRMLATGRDVQGRPVALMGLNFSKVRDGKVEEEWNTWEALSAPPPAE
jgi:predicted SnoaL-like aldol condensation-catalyzing enzyme